MTDLGMFFTAYKEGKAVDFSISTFYEFYPNRPAFIYSEGDDFSYLQEKYSSLTCKVVDDAMASWLVRNVNSNNFRQVEIQKKIKDYLDIAISRHVEATIKCNTEYMLCSQPDVMLRGKLTIPNSVSMLQSHVNHYASRPDGSCIQKFLSKIPGSANFEWWGYPQIFSSKSFLKGVDVVYKNKELFHDLLMTDERVHHSDIWLPVFLAAAGYHSVHNPEVVECLRDSSWRTSSHKLVHQFRDYYPKSGYDGFHV